LQSLKTTKAILTPMKAQPASFHCHALANMRLHDAWRLIVPKEHGSWSLALEPVALGLLAASSRAGGFLALATVAGFFLRRPFKLLLQAKPDDRRPLALACVAGLSLIAIISLTLAAGLGGWLALWSLLPAAAAGIGFAWFDAHGENRAGAAEICGSLAFACLPAAFATLAGWPPAVALALATVMLARSVPTVLLVRTLLRRAKGQSVKTSTALALNLLATGLLLFLAVRSLMPWLPAVVSILLLARAIWYLSPPRPPLTARKLGILELTLGIVVVLTAALAWHI
jgi:hypothetical protein